MFICLIADFLNNIVFPFNVAKWVFLMDSKIHKLRILFSSATISLGTINMANQISYQCINQEMVNSGQIVQDSMGHLLS